MTESPAAAQLFRAQLAFCRGGMTYNPAIYHVTVDVTANGNDLAAATTISKLGVGETQRIVFTNRYTISGTAEIQLDGIKYLEGRELIAGNFVFDHIPLSSVDTYTYTVVEKLPNGTGDDRIYRGIYYSDLVYNVTVVITDPGGGQMKADVTITVPDVTEVEQTDFTNTYQVGNDRLHKAFGGKGSLR